MTICGQSTNSEPARTCGVFYFWGHSYEMITEAMWTEFEDLTERISFDAKSRWADVADLFDDTRHTRKAPNTASVRSDALP